ncbi:hypothetical protein R1sor_026106 [Riccia sorocarpa]|uniref:Endonuclease/exonuclease/phosphatase domain-containing protein n=1 Tax=Riccia sorocarpa TaxID=122646 RepID=A0ABD3GAH1_9MARC
MEEDKGEGSKNTGSKEDGPAEISTEGLRESASEEQEDQMNDMQLVLVSDEVIPGNGYNHFDLNETPVTRQITSEKGKWGDTEGSESETGAETSTRSNERRGGFSPQERDRGKSTGAEEPWKPRIQRDPGDVDRGGAQSTTPGKGQLSGAAGRWSPFLMPAQNPRAGGGAGGAGASSSKTGKNTSGDGHKGGMHPKPAQKRKQRDVSVLCLQEVKNSEARLERQLASLIHGATIVADLNNEARGGTAMLIDPSVRVLNTGTKGDGSCAWAKIQTSRGEVTVCSVYAPGTPQERRVLWDWMVQTLAEGQWIISGDFNMVEYVEDSRGPTAVLRGEELQKWRILSEEWNLSDCWLNAFEREGPWYTRHALRGDRVDQSRLDRIYLSKYGEWVHSVQKVEHIGGKRVSDHIPVVATLQLKEKSERRLKKTTYLKFDHKILETAEVYDEAKKLWSDHPSGNLDPRVKWILAWRRLKTMFKRIQRERSSKISDLEKKEEELKNIRIRLEYDTSEATVQKARELEEEVSRKDNMEATMWRKRSRNRWLKSGEAPSKYFFAQLKAKHQRETIKALQLESGEVVNTEGRILEKIGTFYEDLYKKDEEVESAVNSRERVLSYVKSAVTAQQNQELEVTPTMEELEGIVKRLPEEKAPGLDGATVEVLTKCWSFMKEDCLAMLLSY